MGTFSKRLGQLAAQSFKTEGATIIQTSRANKLPGSLALALDRTLKDGHDMKVFGLGTAASMANIERYGRFTVAMHAIYSGMEAQLDKVAVGPVEEVWSRHGDVLRRAPALALDLQDIGIDANAVSLSPGTQRYVTAIQEAGDTHAGAGLLGHLYCRYFADLFGGQMLGTPTQLALGLPQSPRHYVFDIQDVGRREYIEAIYESLNHAGDELDSLQRDVAVSAAYDAFTHNAVVYNEEPSLMMDATTGVFNVVTGFISSKISK